MHPRENPADEQKCTSYIKAFDSYRVRVYMYIHVHYILVQAFISCRLDYCNSLMSGMADSLLQKVQSVQNAAARLVSGASRRDHITPVLRELHWLPVRQRIHFKLGCLMYKSLSGQTPQYLADDVQLVADSGRRRLRSARYRTCVVPRTHNSFGHRSFSAAGPRVWNALPPELRHDISFGLFRRKLKSHSFVLGTQPRRIVTHCFLAP